MYDYQTAEEYIYRAAELEQKEDYAEALRCAGEGYRRFSTDYELTFMLANNSRMLGEPEQAYLYYLLALSLCPEGEDHTLIEGFLRDVDAEVLDGAKARKLLDSMIRERIRMREFEMTFRFVSDVLYSDDPFLYGQLNDTWMRYYQMILEITSCERQRGLEAVTALRFGEHGEFEAVFERVRFAVRRVWFSFAEAGQRELVRIYRDCALSPEFVVIVTKCSVGKQEIAAVLAREALLFDTEGLHAEAQLIQRYALWYQGQNPDSRPIALPRAAYDNHLRVVEVDSAAGTPEPEAIGGSGGSAAGRPDTEPDRTVAYILCATRQDYVDEVLYYLRRQQLPEDFSMRVLIIRNAPSMTSGYNLGMKYAQAKYKVYIHQDTFVFDPLYTQTLLSYLTEAGSLLLGLAGCSHMPKSGRWWDCPSMEKHVSLVQDRTLYTVWTETEPPQRKLIPVEGLDGVLLATNTDIRWREELFADYHFYDASCAQEYIRRGVPVRMMNLAQAGVLHEVSVGIGDSSGEIYEREREIFVREYLADK